MLKTLCINHTKASSGDLGETGDNGHDNSGDQSGDRSEGNSEGGEGSDDG